MTGKQGCEAHWDDDCPCGCCAAVEIERLRSILQRVAAGIITPPWSAGYIIQVDLTTGRDLIEAVQQ